MIKFLSIVLTGVTFTIFAQRKHNTFSAINIDSVYFYNPIGTIDFKNPNPDTLAVFIQKFNILFKQNQSFLLPKVAKTYPSDTFQLTQEDQTYLNTFFQRVMNMRDEVFATNRLSEKLVRLANVSTKNYVGFIFYAGYQQNQSQKTRGTINKFIPMGTPMNPTGNFLLKMALQAKDPFLHVCVVIMDKKNECLTYMNDKKIAKQPLKDESLKAIFEKIMLQ